MVIERDPLFEGGLLFANRERVWIGWGWATLGVGYYSQSVQWRSDMLNSPCERKLECNDNGVGRRNTTTLDCDCTCDVGFVGVNCGGVFRECLLEDVANAARPQCREGWRTYVRSQYCTTLCLDDYFPSSPRLECKGRNLIPPTFECVGGPMPPTPCTLAVGAVSGIWY